MNRRSALYSMLGVAPALGWQDPLAQLPTTAGEAVAMGLPRFYSAAWKVLPLSAMPWSLASMAIPVPVKPRPPSFLTS